MQRSFPSNDQRRFGRAPVLLVAAGAALLSSACGIDVDEVNEYASATLRKHLTGAAGAMSVVDEADSARSVGDWLGGGTGEVPKRQKEMTSEIEMMAGEIADFFDEYIFIEENVESVRRGRVTYLLDPDTMCVYEDWEGESRIDEECVTVLTEAPVRLVASWNRSDELLVELHIGEDRIRPLDLELGTDRIALVSDYGESARVSQLLAGIFGEEIDMPGSISGKVVMTLADEEDGAYSFTVGIREKIDIGVGARSDYDHFRVELEPAETAFRAFFSGDEAVISLALGGIDVAVARDLLFNRGEWVCSGDEHCWDCHEDEYGEWCDWICEEDDEWEWECDWVEPEERLSGVFDVRLGGLTGEIVISPDQDTVELANLGLGDEAASISLNSLPIYVLDVNEHHGRSFDLSVSEDEGDLLVRASPAMAFHTAHELAALLDDDPHIPAWLLDGFTSFALEGALEPALRFFQVSRAGSCEWYCDDSDECWECDEMGWCDWICDPDLCWECDEDGLDCDWICHEPCDWLCPDEAEDGEPLLQVEAGTLTLDAAELDAPVEVSEGQCLFEADWEHDEDEHPYSVLQAGTCQ